MVKTIFALFTILFTTAFAVPSVAWSATTETVSPVIPVEAFYKRERLENMKISPNGEFFAATVVLEDRTDLVFLAGGKSGVELVGQAKVAAKEHVVDFYWVNPSRVVYRTSRQRGKLSQPVPDYWIYSINFDGTDRTAVIGAQIIDTLRTSESNVLISDGKEVFVWNVYYKKPRSAKIRTPSAQAGEFIADNAGRIRFFIGYRKRDVVADIYQYDQDAQAIRRWKLFDSDQIEKHQDLSVLGFSHDNARVYFDVSQHNGPNAVYLHDFDSGESRFLLKDDNVDPERALVSPISGGVVAIKFLDGKPRLEITDAGNEFSADTERLKRLLPGMEIFITSHTSNGRLAVVYASSDTTPGDFWLFNRETQALTSIIKTGQAMSPEALSPMHPVKFKVRDGLELEGFLTTPRGMSKKNLPMVLLVHGGPFSIFDSWGFNQEAQLLSSRGYAVLQVNFRGSGNYGRKFMEIGYRQWGRTMQDDLTDATHWAINEGIADSKRICIYGASYGGYAALMGATREPHLYACSIGNVGVYDLKQIFIDDARDNAVLDKYFSQTLGNTDLDNISPTSRASEIKIPVLLGAGREDRTAPPLHTERMRDAILKAGGPVDTVIYEGEGHGNYLYKNQIDWANRVLSFLDKNIGPALQNSR